MQLQVAVILLVVVSAAAYSHTYWCNFLSDGYRLKDLECTFNITKTISFAINSDLSMLTNLYEYREKSMNALCSRAESCSLVHAMDMYSEMFEGLVNYVAEIKPVIGMNTFFRQQILNNIVHNGFDLDDSTYQDFAWTDAPVFGFAVVIPVGDAYEGKFTDLVIDSVNSGTADVIKWAKVTLAVGFVVGTEDSDDLLIENHWNAAMTVCARFKDALPNLSVNCHGYVPVRVIQLNPALKSPVQLHPVDPRATMEWDARERLCRDLLAQEEVDYFLLLDNHVIFRLPSFLLTSLSGFMNHRTLMADFGVGYTRPIPKTENTDLSWMVPLLPMVPRSFFELFADPVFEVSFPVALNNMLLVEVFSPLSSVFTHSEDLAIFPGVDVDTDELASTLSDAMLDAYVNRVQSLRSVLIRRVNAVYYPMTPILWSLSDLAYKEGDLLYHHFCERSPGCVREVSVPLNMLEQSMSVVSHQALPLFSSPVKSPARIAFITAVFGGYEKTLKSFARQNIPADFICFTDDPASLVNSNGGWIVDAYPYHLEALQYELEHHVSDETNSLHNNQHPFNVAKYYKMNFYRIPRMALYDVVVWLDGSIEVHNANTSQLVLDLIDNHNQSVVAFARDKQGLLSVEVNRSQQPKYLNETWLNHSQPAQNTSRQYDEYVQQLGYLDATEYWKIVYPGRSGAGLWVTCFVAFDMRKPQVKGFLKMWSDHNRRYTTQDQVSFPYVVQKMRVFPYTLPPLPSEGYLADTIKGNSVINTLMYKQPHGQ